MFLKEVIRSFGFAIEGILLFFKTERNAKVHLVAAIVAVALGFSLCISSAEWLWLSLSITLVLVSEMINTAIEKICNKITIEIDSDIKTIKDVSAGFVLMASIFALVVGAIIFLPYLLY